MSVSRRRMLQVASAGAAAAVLGQSARAQSRAPDFTYKFGHGFPLTHPFHTHVVKASESILKETNGALRIEVYGSSQLGGDSQMISQVRSGGLEMFTTAGLILSTLVPVASIYGLGFTFTSYPALWKAIDGELGGHIRAAIGKVGLHAFDTVWDNGFRQISSGSRPILAPQDLKGTKIRVPVSPLFTSMFSALGAAPVNLNLAETYSALQTQLVDAQENPLVVFDVAKFYEVQKHVSVTNHIWDGCWMMAGRAAWAALPNDIKAIVTKNFTASGLEQRAESEQVNGKLRAELTKRNITFHQPDTAPFKDALKAAGFYAQWKDKYDPQAWAILTKYVDIA